MKNKNLLVCYTGSKGGGAQYAYYVTKNLLPHFDTVDVILSSNNEMIDLWKELPLGELYILDTYNNGFNFIVNTARLFLQGNKQIKRHFSNKRYGCVYVPMTGLWTGTVIDCIEFDQIAVTLHDPIDHSTYNNFLKDTCIRIAHKIMKYDIVSKADKIIILSKFFLDELKSRNLPNCKKIVVVPHGNNIEVIQETDKNKTMKVANDSVNYLFFGRIDRYKGVPILIDAYKKLSKKHSGISLTIAGSGDITKPDMLLDDVLNLKLENRWIKDEEIPSFFDNESRTITVLPYIDATQSGVIPIAQAVGSLVICTNVGGLPEQVDNGDAGVLVNPNSVDELEAAMEDALLHEDKYSSVIERARMKSDANSWSSIAKTIAETIYD